MVEGHRSGLEDTAAAQLAEAGIKGVYETVTVFYTRPARPSRYTPDFPLPNGVIVETKGRFVTADRQKHLHVKAAHPGLDIRFVFSNPNAKIGKKSNTSYADWCNRYGFQWAARTIPREWIMERPQKPRIEALAKAQSKSS